MKKVLSFFKLLFFSVFATTKMLENVEADWAQLTGENDKKQSETPVSEKAPSEQQNAP